MRRLVLMGLTASALVLSGCATMGNQSASKVVFQVSEDNPQTWNLALNNAKNVQNAMGKDAEVEIVAYGPGIGMLVAGSPTEARVTQAVKAGVKVVACQNTMRAKKLTLDQMNSAIGYVPSGVVELMAKQQMGWSYVRP